MDEGLSPIGLKGWWAALRSEQRTAVVVLSLCGLSALGLSLVQVHDQLRSPFLISKDNAVAVQKLLSAQAQSDNSLEELKKKDTDHDGLSDYDELYLYHTSPYLADSDSDGIPDPVEIAQGTDPNCPQGKVCYQPSNDVGIASASSGEAFQEFLNVVQVPNTNINGGQNAPGETGAQKFLQRPPDPATLTPAEIRDYLLTNQLVDKKELDLLPDAAVLEVYNTAYQDALRIQSTAGPAGSVSQGAASLSHATSTSHTMPLPVLDEGAP